MSGDSNALDKAEETEETDVLSLLATESEEDENEEADDDIPETAEELKAALLREREIKSKRNKSLDKAKKAQHRTQEELDAAIRRLDALESRSASQPNAEAGKLEQEAQAWRDRVEDDPKEAIGYMDWKMSQLENNIASYLTNQFSEQNNNISALKVATDPERAKYAKQIEALRRKDEFEGVDDDTLLKIARVLSSAKVNAPRGTAGGKRAVQQPVKKKPVMTNEMRAAMGFEPRG